MGKADELLKTVGGQIMESASHRGTPAAMPTLGQGGLVGGERMAGVSRNKAALEIPVEKIERDPEQPREEFDLEPLERLAESIRTKGLLQPISVRWSEPHSRYIVVAGERRWRAAKLAGLTSISCIVIDRPLEAGELLALQCIENLVREDLKPIEEAKAFRTLLTVNKCSGNQLAKELGISQSAVAQALALLELPEPIQESIESGELAPSTAYAISKLDDPVTQADLATRVVAEGLSRAEAATAVRQAIDESRDRTSKNTSGRGRGVKSTKVTKLPKERSMKTSVGIKIVGQANKGFDDASWLKALEEAAELVREKIAAEVGASDQAAA
jgi:ParB family chromosome partitioning protein